jgi:hypothetical protein
MNDRAPATPVSKGVLLAAALLSLALHLYSSLGVAYGYMSDELYYLECASRLAWGYVDHPPFSIALLGAVQATVGDSLFAIRLVPSLLAALTAVLVGLLARELGGGRTAQGLSALAASLCPVYLGVTSFYSTNAIELCLWALAAWLVGRLVRTRDPRLWLWLGGVLGIGLLNKVSLSWFGLGLGVGLLLTPQRRWLATPWPWAGAAIALVLVAPHLLWQIEHGWPTLEFMENARRDKLPEKSPLTFVIDQVVIMNPAFAPLWILGLLHYFLSPDGRRHRVQAWIWVSVFLLLIASSAVRANYLAPAYTALLAAGGVSIEGLAREWRIPWLPGATAAVLAVTGLIGAPLALPLLPPAQYVAYQKALGVSPSSEEKTDFGEMQLHYALRFGWPEILDALTAAQATLTPAEREDAVVFGSWFGDTGAVNFFGPERGLPPAIGAHNQYWLWGPGDWNGEVALVLAAPDDPVTARFERAERVAEVDCRYCMPNVDRLGVYVAKGLRDTVAVTWPSLKHYE